MRRGLVIRLLFRYGGVQLKGEAMDFMRDPITGSSDMSPHSESDTTSFVEGIGDPCRHLDYGRIIACGETKMKGPALGSLSTENVIGRMRDEG